MNIQVTGPVEVTQSGLLNLPALQAGFPGLPPGELASFQAAGGYYKAPVIPWQYTVNGGIFYGVSNYRIKFTVYNMTNQRNLTNDAPYNGNDFITRQPPRDYDLSFSVML
jgi:hypothetical protein